MRSLGVSREWLVPACCVDRQQRPVRPGRAVAFEDADRYKAKTFDEGLETDETCIAVKTKSESMLLSDVAMILLDGGLQSEAPDREYAGLYAQMADLIEGDKSDTDLAPMAHVADAFTIGMRRQMDPFHF